MYSLHRQSILIVLDLFTPSIDSVHYLYSNYVLISKTEYIIWTQIMYSFSRQCTLELYWNYVYTVHYLNSNYVLLLQTVYISCTQIMYSFHRQSALIVIKLKLCTEFSDWVALLVFKLCTQLIDRVHYFYSNYIYSFHWQSRLLVLNYVLLQWMKYNIIHVLKLWNPVIVSVEILRHFWLQRSVHILGSFLIHSKLSVSMCLVGCDHVEILTLEINDGR